MSLKLARSIAVPLVLLGVLVAGCASDDGAPSASPPGASSSALPDTATRVVTVDGLSFEVPAGYTDVEADALTASPDADDALSGLAERMGVTPEQFVQLMRSVDLYLFSDKGPRYGFLDNINVMNQPGALPDRADIKAGFLQLGAKVDDIRHGTTEIGEMVQVDYTLDVDGTAVAGRGLLIGTDAGVVNITVSTSDPHTSDEIRDRIVDTLDAATGSG